MGDNKPTTRKSVRFTTDKSDNCTSNKNDKCTSRKSDKGTPKKSDKGTPKKSDKGTPKKSDKGTSKKSDKSTCKKSDKSTSNKSDKSTSKKSNKSTSKKSNKLISKKKTTPKVCFKKIFKYDHEVNTFKNIDLCENCDLNTTSINEILTKSVTDNSIVFDFLCRHGVVVNWFKCLKCGRGCHLNLTSKLFLCNKAVINSNKQKQFCNFKISVFKGTFFYKARLSYVKVFEFVYLYFRYPVKGRSAVIIKELSIGPNTFTDWAIFVREVLMHYSRHNLQPIGGPNIIVEIYETKFCANKCNRFGGIPEQWVLAGVERGNRSKQFIIPMPQNDIKTLNKIIKQYIKPESIVHSGIMESFKNLSNEEFHVAIDHKINFVYSGTDAHTQNVESLLRDLYNNIPEFGQKGEHFDGYLAEARFRLIFEKPGERFHQFWRATGVMFPPMV